MNSRISCSSFSSIIRSLLGRKRGRVRETERVATTHTKSKGSIHRSEYSSKLRLGSYCSVQTTAGLLQLQQHSLTAGPQLEICARNLDFHFSHALMIDLWKKTCCDSALRAEFLNPFPLLGGPASSYGNRLHLDTI